ncbi:hypothetical protein D1BOALGB6SA_10300 [Olavius sp. associated proteobacterium Delta 1]|nr:hypothetical protein D1BOALGB6SA_10300 [Olavius sp. associated proteobacterium Delta 1]
MRKTIIILSTLLVAACSTIFIDPDDPDTHIIKGVPHVQQGRNQCGPACLTMVLNYYGVKVGLNTVDKEAREGRRGTPLKDMVGYPFGHGLFAKQWYSKDIDHIKGFLDQDMPVIARVLSRTRPNKACHYIVLVGYTKNGFIANDPYEGRSYRSFKGFNKMWEEIYCGDIMVISTKRL